jgi:hypothetical protein
MSIATRPSACWPLVSRVCTGPLLAAKAAGHSHVIVNGTLIHTDRVRAPGPTAGVDMWWSGKHKAHGGNIQVVSAPDGWPLWTSDVRPGREHHTTAVRADPVLLQQITDWIDDGGLALADLGYEGEASLFRIPVKKSTGKELSIDQQSYNAVHGALRCLSERANSLLKTTYKVLRRYRAAAPGAWAPSSQQPWSYSTTNTIAPHDHRLSYTAPLGVTRNGSMGRLPLPGSASAAATDAVGGSITDAWEQGPGVLVVPRR